MKTHMVRVICLIVGILGVLATSSMTTLASAHTNRLAVSSCLQPPSNVNLLTLSDQTLASYGLPSHAIMDMSLSQWERVLTHAKQHTCGSFPGKLHRSSPIPYSGGGSSNWAGNLASGSRGTYREASADFNVPSISFSNSSAAAVNWAGVGGDGSNTVLVQAGVDTYISNGKQQNESFWEEVGTGIDTYEVNLPLNRLNPGDEVYTFAESNLSGDGYNYFYIANETSNSYNSYTLRNNIFSDSATGECLLERPSVGGNLTPLLELNPNGNPKNSETFNDCVITTNAGSNGIGNYSHYYYNMYDGNTLLAHPGPITNSGHTYINYWYAGS